MNKKQLRTEYEKLLKLDDIEYCKEVLDRYLDFFMKVIWEHHSRPVSTQRMADAKIIFQMFFSKMLSLKNALGGVSFRAKNGSFLNPIIDPTTFIPIVRTIYESVCAFEIVYIIPDTEDKKNLIYNLWVKAGLEYRQRFATGITEPELLKKIAEEQQEIQNCKNFIETAQTYINLGEQEKNKIQTTMSNKDFKVYINGNGVQKLSWQEISSLFGGTRIDLIFKNIYTYFSLYAHPSQVAIFQFQDLFAKDKPFIDIILLNVKFSMVLLSIFLADYIKLFPEIKTDFFLKEDISTQMTLDTYNKFIRGDNFLIDDNWVKALE